MQKNYQLCYCIDGTRREVAFRTRTAAMAAFNEVNRDISESFGKLSIAFNSKNELRHYWSNDADESYRYVEFCVVDDATGDNPFTFAIRERETQSVISCLIIAAIGVVLGVLSMVCIPLEFVFFSMCVAFSVVCYAFLLAYFFTSRKIDSESEFEI